MKEKVQIFLGLGSNEGNRLENIQTALQYLHESVCGDIKKVSSVYETEPVGYTDQSWFLNAVVEMNWHCSVQELLEYIQIVESSLGRKHVKRWGPRTIDIDILLFGDLTVNEPGLEIPHPRIRERLFVLEPLAELEPGMIFPGTEISLIDMLYRNSDNHIVKKNAPPEILWKIQ